MPGSPGLVVTAVVGAVAAGGSLLADRVSILHKRTKQAGWVMAATDVARGEMGRETSVFLSCGRFSLLWCI